MVVAAVFLRPNEVTDVVCNLMREGGRERGKVWRGEEGG